MEAGGCSLWLYVLPVALWGFLTQSKDLQRGGGTVQSVTLN